MDQHNAPASLSVREQRKIVTRLFGFAVKYHTSFLWASLAVVVQSVISVLLPHFLQYYMDTYLVRSTLTEKLIWGCALLYFLGVILRAGAQFLTTFAFNMGSEYMLEDLRRTLFAKLHRLGMSYFDRTAAGSIVSRVNNDTMSISDFMQVFLSAIIGIVSIVVALGAMFWTDWVVAVAVLLFLPVLIWAIWLYSKYSSSAYRYMRHKLSEINTKISETIQGIAIVQNFRQQGRIQAEFEKTNQQYLRSRQSMIRINSLLLAPIVSLLYTLALVAAMGLLGLHAHQGLLQAGMIYAFTTYVSQFFNPIINLMDTLSFFQDGVVAGSRAFKILDSQEYGPQQKVTKLQEITRGAVEFRHVSFAYPGGPEVLHDVSFKLEPGQTLGIVGPTGSGKSTMINIMLRFYEYGQGQILIDGIDLRNLDLVEIRQKIGLVLQSASLFYGDVNFNIRLYNNEISDSQINAAAQLVHADEFIEQLPKQYQTVLTAQGNLSAGQKQLIAFARTVVFNPRILVLDEATANIDTQTEDLIQTGLRELQAGRTTIAIAHRLSTIKDADQILVLQAGRVIERGTHESLLAQKGSYYELYRLQEQNQS
ncbi:ABC transporter ATP-binding protein [Lactobacillus sp. DCY120]|uniref:ABC transporter ATP-binding protein n=1 Tax=Bombilactobacillus apium TaxID=2675299 RepID=A0A850R8G3_9LACO|nr:ABC transporter ATP-binding protein [Bombilactobacillus apium]NVY97012.1 ABC transporter ATP-binding protein [Bombilactobacillus apium]